MSEPSEEATWGRVGSLVRHGSNASCHPFLLDWHSVIAIEPLSEGEGEQGPITWLYLSSGKEVAVLGGLNEIAAKWRKALGDPIA